jgi:hypothetical protein
MNGRVYDPELGRFLSADSFIQDPSNLQSLNRYSYVQNNPLSFTDPTGHFLSGLFHAIGNFFSSIFHAIEHAIKAILKNSIIRAIVQIAICAAPGVNFIGCGVAAAALTLGSGGTIVQALQSFAITVVSAGVWGGIPGIGGVHALIAGLPAALQNITSILVHGVVAGALTVAQGGHFLQGFATGAAGEIATIETRPGGDFGGVQGDEGKFVRAFVSGAAGGTASLLTGGKFANGAITAAFATLYNEYGTSKTRGYELTLYGDGTVYNSSIFPNGYNVDICCGTELLLYGRQAIAQAVGYLFQSLGTDASATVGDAANAGGDKVKLFSKEEVEGFRELFGQGGEGSVKGAQRLLDRLAEGPVELPSGVTQESLERYLDVAQRAIDAGKDNLGVQELRKQAIQKLLQQ